MMNKGSWHDEESDLDHPIVHSTLHSASPEQATRAEATANRHRELPSSLYSGSTRASVPITAEVVDQEDRLRRAEAAGRDQMLAEIVEANVEPSFSTTRNDDTIGRKENRRCAALLVIAIATATVCAIVLSGNASSAVSTRGEQLNDTDATLGEETEDDDEFQARPFVPIPTASPTSVGLLATKCEHAAPISPGSPVPVLGFFGDTDSSAARCDGPVDIFDARWYTITGPAADINEGNEKIMLSVEVCKVEQEIFSSVQVQDTDFQLSISLGGCNALRECLRPQSAEQGRGCSKMSWISTEGDIYHIAVSDPLSRQISDDLPQGPFTDPNQFAILSSIERNSGNTVCSSAKEIFIDPSVATVNFAENQRLVDEPPSFIGCDGAPVSNFTSWFLFRGTGAGVSLGICGDTAISVQIFISDCGDNVPICREYDSMQIDAKCLSFSFLTNFDETIMIAVEPLDVQDSDGDTLFFVTQNDSRDALFPIRTLPFSHRGDTTIARTNFDNPILPCSDVLQSGGNALWYVLGEDISGCINVRINDVMGSEWFNPTVAVFSTADDDYECIAISREFSLNASSEFSFEAGVGVQYGLLVTGREGGVGEFELFVTQQERSCDPTLANP